MLTHAQLHEPQSPAIGDSFCKLYPYRCRNGVPPEPPGLSSSARSAGSATASLQALASGEIEHSRSSLVEVSPGATVQVPLTFEGAPTGSVTLFSDAIDPLTARFGTVQLDRVELFEGSGFFIRGAALPQPANGPLVITNTGAQTANVIVSVAVETDRALTVNPSAEVVAPGQPITITTAATVPDPGDTPELRFYDGNGQLVHTAYPAASGSLWLYTWTPSAPGAYTAYVEMGTLRPRRASSAFAVASGAATLGSTIAGESMPDADADGLKDRLDVTIPVTVATAGEFELSGELRDGSDRKVAEAAGGEHYGLEEEFVGLFAAVENASIRFHEPGEG